MNIRLRSHPDGAVPLGEACEFALDPGAPDIETRPFLRHNRILYLEAVGDWAPRQSLRLSLEATGEYTLLVQWRGGGDRAGQRPIFASARPRRATTGSA